jgi:hypothetical protein
MLCGKFPIPEQISDDIRTTYLQTHVFFGATVEGELMNGLRMTRTIVEVSVSHQ